MKYAFYLILAAALLGLFSACSSKEFLVMNSTEKRTPLDSNAVVNFIYGPEIPIIPENAELVAVMQTNTNTNCSLESDIEALRNTAREIGADLVFIKKNEGIRITRQTFVGSVVTTSTYDCQVLTADLLATK